MMFVISIVPMVVVFGSYFFFEYGWKKLAINLVIQLLLFIITSIIIYYHDTTDYETWSGTVISKDKVWTSCSHSYRCNCVPITTCSGGKNNVCTTTEVCSTCYEHSNDWNWSIRTSNNEVINIQRIDNQGFYEPPRWSSVQLGETTAQQHPYVSYIKASPDSLFRHQGIKEKYESSIPKYPGEVYDYYRINRFVEQGINVENIREWNSLLNHANSNLGSKKQVNMVVVLTTMPHEWYYALEESWIGGKKNDAILVIGIDPGTKKPAWCQVMAWTKSKLFEVKLRDAIMDMPVITAKETMQVFESSVDSYYQRKPMSDFKYLEASISPSVYESIIAIISSLILAVITTFVLCKVDLDKRITSRRW